MKKIIIGATGASGLPLLIACLKLIKKDRDYESHLIMSDSAKLTLKQETEMSLEEVYGLADAVYENDEIGASPASGTFENEGMLIVPCSMKTLAGIHSGYAENLIQRSADVCIKEKRNLVLTVRESPLSPIHLKNMQELSVIQNVYIIPPVMTYYNRPKTIEEMTYQIACRLVKPYGVDCPDYKQWEGVAADNSQK